MADPAGIMIMSDEIFGTQWKRQEKFLIRLYSFGNARRTTGLVINVTILARNVFLRYDKPGLEWLQHIQRVERIVEDWAEIILVSRGERESASPYPKSGWCIRNVDF